LWNVLVIKVMQKCLAITRKLGLGTDAHALEEVGELAPHLGVLHEAGATEQDLDRVLWTPR